MGVRSLILTNKLAQSGKGELLTPSAHTTPLAVFFDRLSTSSQGRFTEIIGSRGNKGINPKFFKKLVAVPPHDKLEIYDMPVIDSVPGGVHIGLDWRLGKKHPRPSQAGR